jgi:hypothetical protein
MKHPVDLSALTYERLLKLRFRDLGVRIKGTWLEECVARLYSELAAKGVQFRPQCYLADEWLTPDNEPVVGIPFYLAHPRLKELERRLMHEVEGGDPASCMQLLRHETGHAVNYAYRFHTARRWKELFGHFSAEYPDRYRYRPYSKSFVLHLDDWYAQYHPDEDFAETFAVWLTPDSRWREKYAGWKKALEKLEYVDALMKKVAKERPYKEAGRKYWNAERLTTTLAAHYRRKTEFYAEYSPDFHDLHLGRIFPGAPGEAAPANRLLAKYRKEILEHVSYWTGERKYIIDRLLRNLAKRCAALKLTTGTDEALPVLRITTYITTLIMNYVFTGRFKRKK